MRVFSYAMFRDLEAAETSLNGLAAHLSFRANLSAEGQTSSALGAMVSGSYFSVLGLEPALGRLLTVDDDRNIGEHFVAVLSHRYWQNQLGADPGVLNSTLVVNGQSMTVVGGDPGGVLRHDPRKHRGRLRADHDAGADASRLRRLGEPSELLGLPVWAAWPPPRRSSRLARPSTPCTGGSSSTWRPRSRSR